MIVNIKTVRFCLTLKENIIQFPKTLKVTVNINHLIFKQIIRGHRISASSQAVYELSGC